MITYFIYDQFSNLIAESDASGNITREYIYLNGKPLALIDLPLPSSAPPQTISGQVSVGCSSIFVWNPKEGVIGYALILSPFFFLVFFQVTRNWKRSGALLLVVLGASFAVSLVVTHRAKAQETGEKIYYYHNDHLGSPIKLTDANQNVVWSWQYGPFGEEPLTMNSNTISQNLRFPGQYYDDETGLHYNFRRYYSPKLGRYLTPDPARGSRKNPQSYNPFPYVANNPIRFIDRWGLMKECGKCGWADCYSNCINKLAPGFSEIFLSTNVAGNVSLSVADEVLFTLGDIQIPQPTGISYLFPAVRGPAMLLGRAVFGIQAGYTAWTAGVSYGCMFSCTLDSCNY